MKRSIKASKHVETFHTIVGVLEYLGAVVIMAFQGTEADWLMVAAFLVTGGTMSMHLARHAREDDVSADQTTEAGTAGPQA